MPSSSSNGTSSSSSGHSRKLSLGSVLSASPKKKDPKGIRGSIERPKVITPVVEESRFGSAIGNRTTALPQFKELGPPDLVHLSKYNSHTRKEDGEYHFVTGIDVSSPIAPMAYLTMLNLNQTTATLKHPCIFTYCSYNVFSRADVRIRTEFPAEKPGMYQLQQLPSDRAQKTLNDVKPEIWEELYVSGLIRAIITGVDIERKTPALIEKPFMQTVTHAKEHIQYLVKYLDRGAQLGASELVNKPSIYQNYLVDALLVLVQLTGLHEHAISEIRKLRKKDLDLLVVKLLLLCDKEIDAVRYLHSALKAKPRDHLLLNEQVKFLIQKGQKQLALQASLASVKAAPLNSESWYLLSKCHILNDSVTNALVALNSMPMYGIRPQDRMLPDPKDKLFYPEPTEGKVKAVWDDTTQVWGPESESLITFVPQYEIQAVDPALLRINKQPLKGTHSKAYELLIIMVNKVGWDGLLKARSEVFLMDEEYKSLSNLSLDEENRVKNIKQKRQCEKWLDDLFLVLYEDLRVVLIVENELANQKQLKHSALEWELIGLTSFRTHHFKNAVAALRTSLSAKFDIIAAKKLLRLWEMRYVNKEDQLWNSFNSNGDIEMSLDVILGIVLSTISYNIRFYNELSLDVLVFLKHFFVRYDSEFIKNKIQVLFENDNNDIHNAGVIPPFDKLVAQIRTFNPEL